MRAWLIEFILPYVIGIIVHKREVLTLGESVAQGVFRANLVICKKGRTRKPVIVALIGLVGSGKSSVARVLAELIGATIVEGDAIRVELRKQGERYEQTRAIAENVAIEIVEKGGNVVLDSDFIDVYKRASLREKARKAGVSLLFVSTYCDIDVISQRIRQNHSDEFFKGASSASTSPEKGKDVKFREMVRRLPLHYRWENKAGGEWRIKKPPCAVLADIDTERFFWKEEVENCTKKILVEQK
jgi:predicted kinase